MDPKRKVQLTAAQMRKMVGKIEAGLRKTGEKLKGKGAVDYASPTVLQAYLRKHPMSKLEFYADKGGVTGAGIADVASKANKKFKKQGRMKSVQIPRAQGGQRHETQSFGSGQGYGGRGQASQQEAAAQRR